jgi:hypothetical protein
MGLDPDPDDAGKSGGHLASGDNKKGKNVIETRGCFHT